MQLTEEKIATTEISYEPVYDIAYSGVVPSFIEEFEEDDESEYEDAEDDIVINEIMPIYECPGLDDTAVH